jgi:hypothetical protein
MWSSELDLNTMFANLPLKRVVDWCEIDKETHSDTKMFHFVYLHRVKPVVIKRADQCILAKNFAQFLPSESANATPEIIIFTLSPSDKDGIFRVGLPCWINWLCLFHLTLSKCFQLMQERIKAMSR